MNKNDFSDIDEQIKHTVENAFDYIGFAGIREDFNNIAENTINEVKVQMKDSASYFESLKDKFVRNSTKSNEVSKYIASKPQGKYSSLVLMSIGIAGAVLTGVGIGISTLVVAVIKSVVNMNFIALTVFLIIVFAINIFMILKGYNIKQRLKRFKKYSECIQKNKYCTIEELSRSVFKKEKYVLSDLKKMASLDMFREAHFDKDNKYFILSDEVYNEYLSCVNSFNARKKDEEVKKDMNAEETEVTSIISNARMYIKEINNANIAIKGKEISEKLYKLELITTEIFKYIEKNPQKISEVKRLTNHYLPMTLKLVESYKELESQSIQGENIKKAKAEIEKSIDLINTAFEKLLDDLFEDVVLDVSSDISVLKTLFTQEGLTKKDFKK